MMQYLNKKTIQIVVVAVGVLAVGVFLYINQKGGNTLSAQVAADKAIAFINQSVQDQGVAASLLDVAEEAGLYRIHLKIQETEYNSYITKDGKLLFPNAFNLEEQTVKETPSDTTNTEETPSYTNLDDFAKCLTEKGMKFYGSKSCSWCAKEKEAFGDSLQYVTYIECLDETTGGLSQACQEAKIESFPTWQLADGKMESGFKTLEVLAEVSGCPIQ